MRDKALALMLIAAMTAACGSPARAGPSRPATTPRAQGGADRGAAAAAAGEAAAAGLRAGRRTRPAGGRTEPPTAIRGPGLVRRIRSGERAGPIGGAGGAMGGAGGAIGGAGGTGPKDMGPACTLGTVERLRPLPGDVCPGPTAGQGSAECMGGACRVVCSGTLALCSGACVDTSGDGQNCGMCGYALRGGHEVHRRQVRHRLRAGLTACGTSCANLDQDALKLRHVRHALSRPHRRQRAAPPATTARAGISCSGNQSPCGTRCLNLANDPLNCNACNNRCRWPHRGQRQPHLHAVASAGISCSGEPVAVRDALSGSRLGPSTTA
jgi:hypothetical protein